MGFLVGTLSIGWLGIFPNSFVLSALISTIAGFAIGGGAAGLIALAAMTYPTAIRSTEIGWALDWGEPVRLFVLSVVGALLGWKWNVVYIFMAMAIP